jgi:hypothetical protein
VSAVFAHSNTAHVDKDIFSVFSCQLLRGLRDQAN